MGMSVKGNLKHWVKLKTVFTVVWDLVVVTEGGTQAWCGLRCVYMVYI